MGAPPVFVRCHSGLGNQLYQYAAAVQLARRRRAEVRVVGGHGLSNVIDAVGQSKVALAERSVDLRVPAFIRPSTLGRETTRRVAKALGCLSTAVFQRPGDHHDPPPAWLGRVSDRRPVLLDGYFHHPGFGAAGIPVVARHLLDGRPRDRLSATIGVHLRRGDFLRLGWDLDEAFYVRALSEVDPERRLRVVVGSDDEMAARWLVVRLSELGWDSSPLPKSGPSAADDLCQLAACQHLVASNSTYSAWAAFVGDLLWQDVPRIVAVPDPWLPPRPVRPPAHTNWIAISHDLRP